MASISAQYNYAAQTGQPPSGSAYQASGSLGSIAFSYTDKNGVDHTAGVGELGPGDTISANGVTWTIDTITPRGSNALFTVHPAVAAPPLGVATFTFTQVATTRPPGPITFPAPALDVDYSATPPMPIDPGGNDTIIVVRPATVIPGEPLLKQVAGHDYLLALPTFAFMPLVQGVKFNLSAVPPWAKTGVLGTANATPPPLLTMTRTPPFPAYPS